MSFLLGAGAKTPVAKQPTAAAGLQIQTSVYGKPIPIVYGTTKLAPNLIDAEDFTPIAHTTSTSSGAGKMGGGGGNTSSTTYTYTEAMIFGLCEGPIVGVGAAWAGKSLTSPAALGLTLFDGSYGQAAWGYMTTNHPTRALGYSGVANLAGVYDLDSSPSVPNNNFELKGVFAGTAPGTYGGNGCAVGGDADPSQVVADLLSNPHYGAGFPAARIGDLSTYKSYCQAAGLWISPAYETQQPAASLLQDIATYTNSEFVWSAGLLTLVPRGDTALNANGAVYNPPSAPLYDLTDDDFLPNTNATAGATGSMNDDPVLLIQKRQADAINDVKIECLDRANQYVPVPVEASDQAAIDEYGRRDNGAGATQAHLFADVGAARASAQLLLQRNAILNTYQFTLDQRYVLLDPMDIVTLTDARLGLDKQWVRITEITENYDGTLTVTAEEYLAGIGAAAVYSFSTGQGNIPDYNVAPGDAVAPIVFAAPVQIAASGLELWLATAGGPSWGGCDVYASSDDSTYKKVGRQVGPSRMGVTTADFPAGSDPDTADTLNVDLSESAGQLISGTQTDADLASTLCLVRGANGDEYVAYETATLAGASKYTLGTYLRRGLYGSAIVDHPSGAPFARLDNGIFKLPYDPSLIGKTLWVKLASFNVYGGAQQSIADVAAYEVVVPAPPAPADVTGFGVAQSGNVVAFSWDKVADYALKGYDLGYAPVGTVLWAEFIPLTEVEAGTEMTTAAVPPGTWLFGIRARDIANQLSPDITTAELTVVNQNEVIYDADEAQTHIPANSAIASTTPGWGGTLNNCTLHYTGVLVPNGTKALSNYATWAALEANGSCLPDPVASVSYKTGSIDTGYVDSLRVYALSNYFMAPGQSGTPDIGYEIDAWSAGADPGIFTPWTIGMLSFRYLRSEIVVSGIGNGSIPIITDFTPVIDSAPVIEQSNGDVAVAAGGTAITFPTPFHLPPAITATATGAGMTSASAVGVTATGFTLHGWTGGADSGGTASWQAEGE